jgi:hypothetical protein
MDINAVKVQAEKELAEERFKEAVKAKKVEILQKKTFWELVFPFKITITRR